MIEPFVPHGTREEVVAEAHAWLRTPYVHQADVKGVGVDCAMLLVRVYSSVGLVPWFDPRPYANQWYMHQSEELYLAGMEEHSHRVDEALPGDLAVYKVGRCVSHGAIVVDDRLAIHAYAESKRVELVSLEELARARGFHFHSYWSVFP